MKSNMGNTDRIIRVILGLFLISLNFWGPKTSWGWIGLIPLITAIVSFCPAYWPFRISTKRKSSS